MKNVIKSFLYYSWWLKMQLFDAVSKLACKYLIGPEQGGLQLIFRHRLFPIVISWCCTVQFLSSHLWIGGLGRAVRSFFPLGSKHQVIATLFLIHFLDNSVKQSIRIYHAWFFSHTLTIIFWNVHFQLFHVELFQLAVGVVYALEQWILLNWFLFFSACFTLLR